MLEFGYYNMDCVEGMKQFPDKYFDLAVVDPPYGLKEHGGKDRSTYVIQKNGTKTLVKSPEYMKEDWDNSPPGAEYFNELFRVSKNQIIFGCNYYDISLRGGRIVWDKCNDGTDQSDAEIAYCSMINKTVIFRYMWRGMMQGKSIFEGTVQQGNKKLNEKRIHPTQKPVALYEWIVQTFCKEGMKLLDTHVGSASSLIAFEKYGYDYVGFEKNQYYYNTSYARMEDNRKQITIFDFIGRT